MAKSKRAPKRDRSQIGEKSAVENKDKLSAGYAEKYNEMRTGTSAQESLETAQSDKESGSVVGMDESRDELAPSQNQEPNQPDQTETIQRAANDPRNKRTTEPDVEHRQESESSESKTVQEEATPKPVEEQNQSSVDAAVPKHSTPEALSDDKDFKEELEDLAESLPDITDEDVGNSSTDNDEQHEEKTSATPESA